MKKLALALITVAFAVAVQAGDGACCGKDKAACSNKDKSACTQKSKSQASAKPLQSPKAAGQAKG